MKAAGDSGVSFFENVVDESMTFAFQNKNQRTEYDTIGRKIFEIMMLGFHFRKNCVKLMKR